MSRIVLRSKIDLSPNVNFSNFQAEENFFHFENLWDISMREEQQQPPDWLILLQYGQNVS